MLLTGAQSEELVARAFRHAGVHHNMAKDAAVVLTMTEMMGIGTHGLARVPGYIERVLQGGVNPKALPQISTPAPALRMVDGQNGLGAAIAFLATKAAMEAARSAGIGAVFCKGSSHLGALAPHLYMAAQAGFAAIVTTNTAPMIAPSGGCEPVLGNSPIGFAIPSEEGMPILLDMALSVVARSKVRRAAQMGEMIPETWATDAAGLPTQDAKAAMQGLMQAIGGGKGANLALCLDLLAGGLSGAAMMSEIPNANLDPSAVANIGHMFIFVDVARLMPLGAFTERVSDARSMVETSTAMTEAEAIRMPGSRAITLLQQTRDEGFNIPQALGVELTRLASR